MKKKYTQQELRDLVYNYKTYSEHGFIQEEIEELIKLFPNFNRDKFNNAMNGNTCMMTEWNGKPRIANYHCDVITGIRCALENRTKYGYEFD